MTRTQNVMPGLAACAISWSHSLNTLISYRTTLKSQISPTSDQSTTAVCLIRVCMCPLLLWFCLALAWVCLTLIWLCLTLVLVCRGGSLRRALFAPERRGGILKGFASPQSQDQILVLTVLHVPSWLDSGDGARSCLLLLCHSRASN